MEEIKLNLDNLTEEEREQLMKLIEKSNKKKRKVWKPDLNETYYAFESGNGIANYTWEDDYYDNLFYEIGNCYETEEEAEFAVEKRKVEVELQRFADEHNDEGFDIFDNCKKYVITHGVGDYLGINFYYNNLFGNTVCFSSVKIAEQAIETIGKDRILKYIFGVK